MKRTLSVAIIAFTLALFPGTPRAQQTRQSPATQARAPGDAPTVRQIIDRYVRAIGGEAAHRKLTSRVTRATYVIPEMQNLTGTAVTYEKAPAKALVVLNFPGVGISREAFDGAAGWAQEPGEEARALTGAELAAAKADGDFYREIRLTELFPKLTLKGTERVGGKTAYKLEGVSADGYTETMYFDAETGLLLRADSVEQTPEGSEVVEIHFDDYREVDGIRMPFTARHRSPGLNIIFKVVEVRHNVPVEDAVFSKPGPR